MTVGKHHFRNALITIIVIGVFWLMVVLGFDVRLPYAIAGAASVFAFLTLLEVLRNKGSENG